MLYGDAGTDGETVLRASAKPDGTKYKILGWDAAGVVKAAGPDCTLFRPGDEVYYAGSIARSQSQAVVRGGRPKMRKA